ncbi:MAG: hypothetical protein JST42_06350 [Bacteroidetes bacterium]|nr:hypothetical protein [Bacteroidota bacterium]
MNRGPDGSTMTAGADYALQSGTASLKINNGFRIVISHFYARNVYMEHFNLSKAADELMTAEAAAQRQRISRTQIQRASGTTTALSVSERTTAYNSSTSC